MKHIKLNLVILAHLIFLFSCGTLGGFDTRSFPVEKNQLSIAFDSIYVRYPEYKIPDKWKKYDD